MTRKTITYKGLSIRDPAPYGEAGLAWQENFVTIADTLDSLQGSLDTALGGLVIGVDIQAYSANLDTWSSIAPSADGQSLVAAVDYAAMRGLLGVRPGADVQGYSAALGAIAGLTPIDGNVIVGDGSTWVAESGAMARASLGLGSMATQAADAVAITGGVISGIADLAVADGGTGASDAAGARANLGLAIGADVQAHSATLDTWAGVLPSANGQSLVSAVDYAAMRGLLDLEPGTDVQAYSSRLGAIAALTPTDGNLIVGNGTTWVTQSGETARTTLGLGSMATQAAGDVAITGGAITGITDLAVADGGTGASDAAGARGNLGLGSIATQAANSVAITGGAINGTAIGATTPGTGTFTTLSATGTIDTPETTSSTVGLINIGGLRIHGFRHPTGDTARPNGNNVFIGQLAGNFTMGAEATRVSEASLNTGIGYLVLNQLTTGYSNTAIGDRALSSLTEGIENTAIGRLVLQALTTGSRNVGLGYHAGRFTTGSSENQTTSYSTYIGASTKASADGVTNETVIGYNATGRGSNTVQIGNSFVTDTYISGWLNLPSDTRGIKLDAAGTTTLYSDGLSLKTNKRIDAPGLELGSTTTSIGGIVFKDAERFLHDFHHPTGGTAVPVGQNVFLGKRAGNFTMGSTATSATHASHNVGVGYAALSSCTTGYANIGLGSESLAVNTTGYHNVAVGRRSLYSNETGSYNVGVGFFVLYSCTTGYDNTGLGSESLRFNTTGYQNVAVGSRSLYSNETGRDNIGIGGTSPLRNNTTGSFNIAVGSNSLFSSTTGSYNIGIGHNAGTSTAIGGNTTSENSIYIGANTKAAADGDVNETVIGYAAVGRGSNTVQIGNHLVTDTYINGWLNLPSDTAGLKLDAAGTTTLVSDSTLATLSKPLKTAGYKASDGSAGISETITFKDADNVTHTLTFKDGLLISYTEV
jgi:hypothetical protein